MGHAISHIIVDNKKQIFSAAEDFAYENVDFEENPSGSYHGDLTIHDIDPLPDYDAAVEKIHYLENGRDYSDHAVPFYAPTNVPKTKKQITLENRVEETIRKYNEFDEKSWVGFRTSKYIGCDKCGSKLSREHLRKNRNECPLCHEDLRPASTLKKISGYRQKIRDLRAQIKSEVKKAEARSKKELKWLVKVEVHC